MKLKRVSATLLCCALLAPLATPAGTDFSACPKALLPYEAVYVSRYKKITLTGERSFKREPGGRYLLSHNARRMGNYISESSEFLLLDDRIQVQKYDMSRSAVGIKREYHNHYDWENGQVQVTGHAEVTLPLDEYPLDLLSHQVALRCDIEAGAREVSYPVVTRNRIREYTFSVSGEEQLETALGKLNTIVVERNRKNSDRTTRVWLAPALNYLIVRLEQYEAKDAASYSLEIREASLD